MKWCFPKEAPSRSAQLFKEVQCLSVVGDEHHFVTRCSSRYCQDVVKNQHFTCKKQNYFLPRNRKRKHFTLLMLREMHHKHYNCNNHY